MKTSVENMESSNGNKVANQFIIHTENSVIFQSYNSVIVKKMNGQTFIDSKFWDYSKTTRKYRNQFLNETKKQTEQKISSGEYILTDLN